MTTALEAKQRITTLLQARSALQDVQVTYSGPIREPDVQPDMIFLGEVIADQDWGALGNRSRHEEYSVEFFVVVWRDKNTTELDTETRCFELLIEIANALADDPSLSDLLNGNAQLGSYRQSTQPTLEPIGWAARATGQIRCETALHLT